MASKDLHNQVYPKVSLNMAARTATANGGSVDMLGYNSAEIIVTAGVFTDGSHVITLEESAASGSGFTAVAAANRLGSLPTIGQKGDENQTYKFGYIGSSRYIRVVATVTGASTGCVYGAVVVRGEKRHVPTVV